MKSIALCLSLIALTACGGSTDTKAVRYNFAVIDGANQISAAGDAALEKRVTSQLTRDPQGTFATRVLDFFAPAIAYAQALTLSGTPVSNAIVCGREAIAGEPQIVPLCAFTLADGKAANTVVPGTRAGTYNILFTAQVQSQEPVKDSTTVKVLAGPVDGIALIGTFDGKPRTLAAGSTYDVRQLLGRALDAYGNEVTAYTVSGTGTVPGVAVDGPDPGTEVDGCVATAAGPVATLPVEPGTYTLCFWVDAWQGHVVVEIT